MHDAGLCRAVVDREVLGAAIIPGCQHPFLPAETAGEHRLCGLDQRLALFFGHILKVMHLASDIERRLCPSRRQLLLFRHALLELFRCHPDDVLVLMRVEVVSFGIQILKHDPSG
jgi:hypothetical protein